MSIGGLGRLQKVSLRDIWTNETSHFTPWLSESQNLKLLGETIGIDLECHAQEKEVGPFRADILCRDTATDTWVLIENQLERTDHTHLGQLLTYAAGLDAVTIVWISERFTQEHRAALDWLNEKTGDGINFFGLEIELWRIEDSPAAPKFNIVSEPNNWTRSIRGCVSGELSEDKRIQLAFWTQYRDFVLLTSDIQCGAPRPHHAMIHSLGRPEVRLASIASMWNSLSNSYSIPEIRIELVLDGRSSKQLFGSLESKKLEIENGIGMPLTWSSPDETKRCRIYARRDADIRNQTLWHEQHQWLLKVLEDFRSVFSSAIAEMDVALT